MVATGQTKAMFDDARAMHAAALDRLAAGDIRDAAEKAWCAARRAAEALILAQTGDASSTTSQVSGGIRALGLQGGRFISLRNRFGAYARFLHGDCFYDGNCEPHASISEMVRETRPGVPGRDEDATGREQPSLKCQYMGRSSHF